VATFNARGVGFLRYFQLKQLPNFLLASPILSLAVCSVLHYVRSQPEIFFSLGFRASNGEKRPPAASPLSLDRVPESDSSHLKEKSSAKMQGTAFKLNHINYLFMCIFLAVMVILVPLIKNNIFIE
jgi:phosphatidylinositol glycan class V